jgi:hypothetical protein
MKEFVKIFIALVISYITYQIFKANNNSYMIAYIGGGITAFVLVIIEYLERNKNNN